MTRTARGRRGTSANPKRARAAHQSPEPATPAEEQPPAQDEGERSSFWHTLLHDRSVRSRVAALVIVPLLGTLVLGALFFKNALDDAGSAGDVEQLATVGVAATDLLHRIQDERDVTGLNQAGATGVGAVGDARDRTDTAIEQLRGSLGDVRAAGPAAASVVEALDEELDQLATHRAQSDESDPAFDAGGASGYHELAEAVRGVVTASGTVVHDGETARLITGLDNITQAVESASMERGLVTFHLTPGEEPSSSLTTNAVVYRGQQDLLLGRYLAGLDDTDQAQGLASRIAGADELTAETIEEIRAGDEVGQSHEQWFESSTERLDTLRSIETEAAETVVDQAASAASGARTTAILSAVAVLIVLALTIFLAVVVARSIVGPLRRLRGAAQQTATKDLPAFVERIHRDGPAAAATFGSGADDAIVAEGNDEIGEVANAFNDVHAMAVRIAADQALLRQNLDTIVVNLSRRTQSLVDRQLGELESLEQRERDPDQLSTLFRIDHMATRVRRHAESLLVLAGVQEMRKQSSSAPVLDVVRTAVGEVEQYPRVKFGVMPTDLVSASAVDDIAHLLAELIDNATEFSSPSTPVRVTSQPLLGGGLRIQVTDSGLGIPAEQLEKLNERLANVGDIDVATSRTLGLYVVARLSAKHGIRVRLEPGSTGGTVAHVDLPANLIHSPLDSDVQLPGHQQHQDPFDAPRAQMPASRADTDPGHTQSFPEPDPFPPPPADRPAPRAPARPAAEPSGFPPPPAQPPAQTPEPAYGAHSFTSDRTPAAETTGQMFAQSAQAKSESPIFESVRSAWFSSESSSDWSSPADAGWRRAAEVLRSAEEAASARHTQPAARPPGHRRARPAAGTQEWPSSTTPSVDAGRVETGAHVTAASETPAAAASSAADVPAMNAAGLPVRRRGASLVPGSIAEQPDSRTSNRPAAPAKSADSVSSTLASLQRGVGRGRQETGGWVPKRPSDPERSRQ
ncbi:sensor histidine kinase [Phytoactinopolyspora mesophila]|uniref:histidine kinase n=1 Tax=Phytoactinopolyspora mesophila TaxID=2650750 RepID=A0A7K3M4M5_9ACTN|nr:sensor histidine kinase [Phytoactinopolyspora mesophila]NDL57872.1 HAMP domain-containing protein [Phytoactinopolyspora mesophila]